MKKLVLVLMCLVLTVVFASCNSVQKCRKHLDENNDGLCEKCGDDAEDKSNCPHTDADDDFVCDKCEMSFSDGKDVERTPTQGIIYSVSKNGTYAIVTGYSGTDAEVVVDSTYNGLPVKEITDKAFTDCTIITKVIVSDGIKEIDPFVFENCTNLTSIIIPSSVKYISASFETCTSLTSINVDPDNKHYKSVKGNLYSKNGKTLEQYAIGKKETSFVVPNIVKKIDSNSFNGCTSLTSITIPESVTSIGYFTFENCIGLTSITIPDSVTEVGGYAFGDCTNLTSAIIGNGVVDISTVFSNCTNLTSVTLGNSLTSIGSHAFWYCNSLTNINIPESVTIIDDGAFCNCSSLTSVTIPNGVTKIGAKAFSGCDSITSITIPDSVSIIGDEAFAHCKNLTTINVDVNNEHYKSIDGNLYSKNGKLLINGAVEKQDSTFIIPDGVEVICDRAFYSLKEVKCLVIPKSVTSIGHAAFYLYKSNVYYKGTVDDWSNISIGEYNINFATTYYYSDSEPTEEGNYWHYDENGEIAVW